PAAPLAPCYSAPARATGRESSLEATMAFRFLGIAVFCLLLLPCRQGRAQSEWPELNYRVVPEWPALPEGWNFGETSGVALDAQDNVYVFHRGPHPLIQFQASGKFIRYLLDGMITSSHGARVDSSGNIWAVDVKGH